MAEQARSRAFPHLLATRDLQGDRGQASPQLRNNESELIPAGTDPSGAVPPPSGSAFWKQWINDYSEVRSSVSVRSMSLGQIQASALRLNSTILSYWVSDDATYIWVVPPSGEKSIQRGSRSGRSKAGDCRAMAREYQGPFEGRRRRFCPISR